MEILSKNKVIRLITLYRPLIIDGKRKEKEFIEEFGNYLDTINNLRTTLICGDFNLWLDKVSECNCCEKCLYTTFFFYYISQCVCCLNLLSSTTCHLHLALICRAKLFEFTEYYLNRLCFVLFCFDLFALGNVGLECNLFVCF